MSVNLTPVIAVFARSPIEGMVKRRIAAERDDRFALRVHMEITRHTLQRIRPVARNGMFTEIWVAGEFTLLKCKEWASLLDGRLRQQQGDDIGSTMWHCLYSHIHLGRSAMVVGSDVVSIDAEYVLEARDRLAENDMVIGPAEDGGYGLIGLSVLAADLFRDMPWGTNRVFELTMERARKKKMSVHVLPTLWDVDTVADYERFKATYPPPPPRPPLPIRYPGDPPYDQMDLDHEDGK